MKRDNPRIARIPHKCQVCNEVTFDVYDHMENIHGGDFVAATQLEYSNEKVVTELLLRRRTMFWDVYFHGVNGFER
jgi:hypothetical protein